MRTETKNIVNNYYDKVDIELFKRFAKIIENDYQNRESHREIWEYDLSLGGLGGYATPLSPVNNPFNSLGKYRNVFRSLQYARCDMFYSDRPRHIIIDTALHVETLVKIVVSNNKIMRFVSNYLEFGKNINIIYKKCLIDDNLYKRLNYVRKILNVAKHDTDPNKDNTFDYVDAVVFYFECRLIGNELLKLMNHPTCNIKFEIKE